MSSPYVIQPTEISDFSGGLNTNDRWSKLEDNEFAELINWDLDKKSLIKRGGFDQRSINHAPFVNKAVKLIGYFYKENNQARIVANPGLADDKVYYSDDGCVTWTESLIGGVSASILMPKTVPYFDRLYGGTLNDGVIELLGSTGNLTSIAGSPNGYTGDIVLDRMFVFSPSTQTVRYSDPAAFSTWPAANSFLVGGLGLDGDLIIGMVEYKDKLVIFKQNSIWILYMTGTPVNWQLRKYIDGIGATSMYAITKAEDYIYFIGHRGVYRTNLSTLEELSGKIYDNFRDRGSTGDNVTNLTPITGSLDAIVYWNNKVLCKVNTALTTQLVPAFRWFVYYTAIDCWIEWTPSITVADPINFLATSHTRALGGADNNFPQGIYWGDRGHANPKMSHYNEDNLSVDETFEYECSLQTKEFLFDSFSLKKIPYVFAYVSVGDDSSLDIYYNGVLSKTSTMDGPTTTSRILKVKCPGYVRALYIRFVFEPGAGANNYAEIRTLGLAVREPRPYVTKEASSAYNTS